MKVKRIVNSVFNSNTFIVYENREAIIMDIGDFNPVIRFIREKGLNVEGLFITHTHYDHIYGIKKFMSQFPDVPIYTSSFGKKAFNKSNWNFSRYHEDVIEIESEQISPLYDGDELSVLGRHQLQVIATTGHDKSSLSYRVGNLLFTGDSYIPEVKVIASFPNSNREDAQYWYGRLKEMSREYIICPGHGDILEENI